MLIPVQEQALVQEQILAQVQGLVQALILVQARGLIPELELKQELIQVQVRVQGLTPEQERVLDRRFILMKVQAYLLELD